MENIKIVNQLKDFGRTIRGWLGVQITPVSKEIAESLGLPDEKGAFISSIVSNGPARTAGIQEGDIILKFNFFISRNTSFVMFFNIFFYLIKGIKRL